MIELARVWARESTLDGLRLVVCHFVPTAIRFNSREIGFADGIEGKKFSQSGSIELKKDLG